MYNVLVSLENHLDHARKKSVYTPHDLLDNFLKLLDHLINPHLNLLLLLFLLLSGRSRLRNILRHTQSPRIPLVDGTFPLRDELRTDGCLLRRVRLIKRPRIFAQVPTYIAFLVFG